MPILDEKDLIQVDAKIVAGILILLTLTSIIINIPKIDEAYILLKNIFIAAAIIPFCVSASHILKGNFHPRPPKGYLRVAGQLTSVGFAYLIVVVIIVVGFPIVEFYLK